MQKMPDLNDFPIVAAIVKTGSLQSAAKLLGVNQATVFRRLDAMEQRLGVRLFDRQGGRYSATLAGEEMAQVGANMESQAQESLRKVAGYDLRPSGEVRLTTTDSIAHYLLIPLLANCRARHRGIQLQLLTTNQPFNLSKRDADIALRSTVAPPEHLIGKRIAQLAFAVYANPLYYAEHAHQIWTQHDWVSLDESMEQHKTLRWLTKHIPGENIVFRSNSFNALRQACAAGIGLALLPCFMAEEQNDLQRVSEPVQECAGELWLLTHPDLRNTVRVKTVFTDLHEQLMSLTEKLEGKIQG